MKIMSKLARRPPIRPYAKLVPELMVSDIAATRHFWCDLIGFSVLYERADEGFVYLGLDGAELMLDRRDPGSTAWETGPLDPPLGRGINLQVEVPSLDAVLDRLRRAGWPLFVPFEERWYRAGTIERGQRQFLVQDPDGYLVRPIESLGERPFKG